MYIIQLHAQKSNVSHENKRDMLDFILVICYRARILIMLLFTKTPVLQCKQPAEIVVQLFAVVCMFD